MEIAMKHEPSDWKIDVSARQALHVSGLLIRAEERGGSWEVQPHPQTLPPHGEGVPREAREAAMAWIKELIITGGDLLVRAVARHKFNH